MRTVQVSTDHTLALRREVNALQGLLLFSIERSYPQTVRSMICDLLGPRTAALEDFSESVGAGHSAPAAVSG